MKDFIGQEADREYAERSQAEVQIQVEETVLHMLELGGLAFTNGIKTASVRFLQMVIAETLSRGATNDSMSKYWDLWI